MESLPVLAWALLRTETCWSSGFLVARGKEIIKNIKWTKHSLKKKANLFSWKPILSFKDLQMATSWPAPTARPLNRPFRQQHASPPQAFWSPCSYFCGQFLCHPQLGISSVLYETSGLIWSNPSQFMLFLGSAVAILCNGCYESQSLESHPGSYVGSDALYQIDATPFPCHIL